MSSQGFTFQQQINTSFSNPIKIMKENFKGDTPVNQRWGPSSLIHQSINRNGYIKKSESIILGLEIIQNQPKE